MKKIILFSLCVYSLFAREDIDKLVQDVLSGKTDSAAIYLPAFEKLYPNDPDLLFLKALMTMNGLDAKNIYMDIYNNHPSSDYGDDAVMKVSEYFYAAGLYGQSAEWLKKMPLYYGVSCCTNS